MHQAHSWKRQIWYPTPRSLGLMIVKRPGDNTSCTVSWLIVLQSNCMVQNDPSLLNGKGVHRIVIRHFRFANSPYGIGFFDCVFKTSNRLKSLLLITLGLERTFDSGSNNKRYSSRKKENFIHCSSFYKA